MSVPVPLQLQTHDMKSINLRIFASLVCFICLRVTLQQEPTGIDHWAKSRQKRFLIFPKQGVQKLILSIAMPVDLKDKRSWRSLAGAWNLQWQHNLPLTVIHWWNSTYFPAKDRSFPPGITPVAPEPVDLTATFLYEIIEAYMTNKGMRGRECLQRSICQNAQVHFVGGVVDQIYKRLLTPERTMEDHYKDAYVMGSKGVDCYETFHCPKGHSVFDQFVEINEVN